MPHDGPQTDARQDLDAAFADVLARAAALPSLPAAEYNSADELVDAQIKLVVEHSTVRVRFPKPGQAPREQIFQPSLIGGPRLQLALGEGRSHRMLVRNVLSCAAARSSEPVMLLVRTSEESYTVIFRMLAGSAAPVAPAQAHEIVNRMVRAIADDVGRRLTQPSKDAWQMRVALVAARNDTQHTGAMPGEFQWWTGSFRQQDFAHLLRLRLGERYNPPRGAAAWCGNAISPVVEPVPCEYMHGSYTGLLRSWRRVFIAEHDVDVLLYSHARHQIHAPMLDARAADAHENAAERFATELGYRLAMATGRAMGILTRLLLGPIDKIRLKHRLPAPPAPAVPIHDLADPQTSYRVLLDRELTAC